MERMICQCCGEALHKRGDAYECGYCGATYRDDQAERAADLLKGLLDDFKLEQLSNARRRLYETTHEKYPSSQAVTQAAGNVLSISPDDFMARVYLHSHDSDPHELIGVLARSEVSEWEAKETLAWLTRSLDMRTLAAVKDFADRHFKDAAKTKALTEIEGEALKLDSGVYDVSLKRDVFLCYSTEDMPRVIEIMETFEENALSCFAAFRNLRHGKGAQENYQEEIFRAMKNCRVFVFLSSNSSRDLNRKGVVEELNHLISDLPKKPRVEFLLEDYPERMPFLAKRRMAEAFPHLEHCRDVEDLLVRVSDLLDAEENAERDRVKKLAEEASERAKKELQAEFEAREAARKEEQEKRQKELEERLAKEREEQTKRQKELEERLAKEREEQAKRQRELDEERERKQRELEEERLRLEKERLDIEKRRIEAENGSSALPPVGGAMDAESMLAMMEKAEELKRRRAEEAADKRKAEPVEKAIEAIGKVEFTPECHERIATARAAYSGLTEGQRAFVHNADALLAAEREYEEAEAKERERKRQEAEAEAERKRLEAEEREKAIEAVFAMRILPNGGASVQGLLDKEATAVTIPEHYRGQTVTSIGFKAFSGCSKLESIAIPSTVTSIGELAFAGCGGLTTLLLPSGLRFIGKEAFYNCSEDLYICFAPGVDASRKRGFDPDFLKGFRGNVLYGVTDVDQAIRTAQLEAEYRREKEKEQAAAVERVIEAIGDVEYSPKCKSRIDEAQRLYDILPERGKKLVLNHATLTSAVAEYEKLKAEELKRKRAEEDADRKKAEATDDAIKAIGTVECSKQCKSRIDEAQRLYDALTTEQRAFVHNAEILQRANQEYAKAEAEERIDDIFDMEIFPNGHASVAKCRDKKITGTAIPERYRGKAITQIGDHAFDGCSSLKSIAIPNGVNHIGGHAFEGCSSLESISIPGSVTSIGYWAFCGCRSLTSITIPNGVTFIGEGAFRNCSSLKSIAIPSGVTHIGRETFGFCDDLKSVTVPNSVTFIGEDAFHGCKSLTSITIPKGITDIRDGAFFGCSSLTSIVIPKSVTSLDKHAFLGCSSLKSIAIPSSVTKIGEYAFKDCKSLTSITIPESVTSIGVEAFRRCSSLTSITIPESVTKIGDWAFCDCSCAIHFAHKKPLFGYPEGFSKDCLLGFKGKAYWGGK